MTSRKPARPAESLLINEVQLLLAEKRTSLAMLRTGIAVFALPMSVLSILVATSRYYDPLDALVLLAPLLLLSLGLVALGTYLVTRSVRRIHRYDRRIAETKKLDANVERLVD